MQVNLNFQADTQVCLLCSIAVGLTHSFLLFFNLQTQIGKVVFIYSGKYAGPKVFDLISSVAMRSAANVAIPVPVDLQDL